MLSEYLSAKSSASESIDQQCWDHDGSLHKDRGWIREPIRHQPSGHFALTRLLIDPLLHSQALRVANIGSDAHRFGRMNIDRIVGENGNVHSPSRAYARSKLAILLFTYELQRRLVARRLHTFALAAHPGISSTNLGQHLEKRWTSKRNQTPFKALDAERGDARKAGIC